MIYLGFIYKYHENKLQEALKWYLRAYEISPKTVASILGEYYTDIGEYKTAIDYFKQAKIYVCCWVNQQLGLCYLKLGDYSSALQMFNEGANLGYTNCFIPLGDYYLHIAKDIKNAQLWYSKAMEHNYPEAKQKLEQLAMIA
jgi:TPR repeat protein